MTLWNYLGPHFKQGLIVGFILTIFLSLKQNLILDLWRLFRLDWQANQKIQFLEERWLAAQIWEKHPEVRKWWQQQMSRKWDWTQDQILVVFEKPD